MQMDSDIIYLIRARARCAVPLPQRRCAAERTQQRRRGAAMPEGAAAAATAAFLVAWAQNLQRCAAPVGSVHARLACGRAAHPAASPAALSAMRPPALAALSAVRPAPCPTRCTRRARGPHLPTPTAPQATTHLSKSFNSSIAGFQACQAADAKVSAARNALTTATGDIWSERPRRRGSALETRGARSGLGMGIRSLAQLACARPREHSAHMLLLQPPPCCADVLH